MKKLMQVKNVTKPAELFHEFPFHNIRAKLANATTEKFTTNYTSKSLYKYPRLFGNL
jgi:hypothetical protein